MNTYTVEQIAASKYGADRWRFKIGGDWYDAYLPLDPAALPATPCALELDWKESKAGKQYISAAPQLLKGAPAAATAAPRAPAGPPAAPVAGPGPSAHGPAAATGDRDQWIFAEVLLEHWIANQTASGIIIQPAQFLDIAGAVANAARRAASVLRGSPVDVAREAIAAPRPATPAPDPRAAAEPRNTGPDFDDDDIPFN